MLNFGDGKQVIKAEPRIRNVEERECLLMEVKARNVSCRSC